MPDSIVIEVENLAKKYRLFNSPADRFKEALHPFKKVYHREFWALKDVSFKIPAGRTVGIVGRNGSGKSTLLQIIAAVLRPTEGRIAVNGQVAALLELGAGFNPQFTGRENVMLGGAIQGIREDEMRRRLPEIENFAQIGEFFDRPTKIYSSGMFARLAFAAAIHVDPDIMVIDEILAVGDARFKQKCFNRLEEFRERGKTILFVSHDIETVVNMCDIALLIDEGRLVSQGEPKLVADRYREILFSETARNVVVPSAAPASAPLLADDPFADAAGDPKLQAFLAEIPSANVCARRPAHNEHEHAVGGDLAEIVDFFIDDEQANRNAPVPTGTAMGFYVKVLRKAADIPIEFGIHLRTVEGMSLFGTNTVMQPNFFARKDLAQYSIFKFRMNLNLQGGDYFIDLGLFQWVDRAAVHLNNRRRIVHLKVQPTDWFDGPTDLTP